MLHFNPVELRPVVEETLANQCELLLVKDQGIYLMSAEGEWRKDGHIKYLVYADGCHPEKDEDWYDTACEFAGGDDFCEHLKLDAKAAERILSEGNQLRIHLLKEELIIHVAPVEWVCVADYRRMAARLLQQANVHYPACVGKSELKRWRNSAINLLGAACYTACKRVKPRDREEFQAAFGLLKQRIDSVNAQGAIRYPAC